MRRHRMQMGWIHPSWRVGAVMVCLFLPGCLVQKADLTKVEQGLNDRIKSLDKQAQELQTKMAQASTDIDRLVGETRARLSSEIHEMRDQDLPKFQGKLEDTLYQLNSLAGKMDDRAVKTEQLMAKRDAEAEKRFASIEKALNEQASDRKALQEESAKVTATITAMAKTVDARLQEHDKSIAAQSKAMNSLGDKMVQQDQRTEVLTGKVEADAKTTTVHLAEVNKSILSITKTLEAVGGKFQTKVQEQDRRAAEMARSIDSITKTLEAVDGRFQTTVQEQDRRAEEMAKSIGLLQAQVGDLARAVHDLRAAKESSPSKKGSKQGRRSNEETRDPRIGQLQDSSQSGETSGQVTEPIVAAPLSTDPAPVGGPPPDHNGEVRQAYDRSLQQFKQGDLNGALQGFSDFLTQHPSSGLAPNAQYWIGECWYGKKDFERAIEAFDRVQGTYPTSDKVPAAILKKAFAYLGMKDRKRASSTLRQVVDAYPRSPEAGKASEKLAQLRLQ